MNKIKNLLGCVSTWALVACAHAPEPKEELIKSEASIKGAEVGGAREVPEAALHLRLAEETIQQARALIEDKENEKARMLLIRAKGNADLALALAEAKRVDDEVQKLDDESSKVPQVGTPK